MSSLSETVLIIINIYELFHEIDAGIVQKVVENERVRMVIQRTWNRFLEGLAIRIMIVIYMLAYS